MKDFIAFNKTVTLQQLMNEFQVSDMTIRRDLDILEKFGFIKRVHGGAIYIEQNDIPISIREDTQRELKERIADQACSFIKDGDAIALDAGSTTLEIAKRLLLKSQLTVLTNAINIAALLTKNTITNNQIILAGGPVIPATQSTVGEVAASFLKRFQVNHAFIGCSAISLEKGLMNSNMAEGEMKQGMMEIADRVYVVADETKFTKTSFNTFASFEKVDAIITTKGLDEKIKKEIRERTKIELILV